MSREFGSYMSGYFHTQIEYAADDCLCGRDGITRLWGEFLKAFYPVAYAISTSEACDSDVDYPIMECIRQMPELESRLKDISEYLRPFEDVIDEAIKDFVSKNKPCQEVNRKE